MRAMELIMHRLEECYQLAERHFNRPFPRPQVTLDLRGQKAGVAYLSRNLLRFNGQLYRENAEDFLRQTVPHEAAHLLAHALYGERIRPHGKEWKGLMTGLFGLPALRCHDYQVPRRRDRKSTRLNSSHVRISYAVFCLKKKKGWIGEGVLAVVKRLNCFRLLCRGVLARRGGL